MKAVILAAGRGKRMGSLTTSRPKPLLEYRGKSLLSYTLNLIQATCSEIVIVIGYLGEQIQAAVGESWNGVPVRYVSSELKGTGEALWKAQPFLGSEDFIVFPADDIYSRADLEQVLVRPSILVSTIQEGTASGGKIVTHADERLVSITEGTHEAPFMVSTGMYHLTPDIFSYPLVQIPGRDEYGLPQSIVLYAADHPVSIVHATSWKQVVGPEDLL